MPTGRPCTSCTCCSPTRPGASCRRATSTTTSRSRAASRSARPRPRSSSWATSGTCSRWPTPTG
jgi:hypothetical protein